MTSPDSRADHPLSPPVGLVLAPPSFLPPAPTVAPVPPMTLPVFGPPSVGWHEEQSTVSADPSGPALPIARPKQSFSASELDDVPRYIAPEENTRPNASPAPRKTSPPTDWNPHDLGIFHGADWVPPAVSEEERVSYVAPRPPAPEREVPRALLITLAGVALVAGLGFGVSKALTPSLTPETANSGATAGPALASSTTLGLSQVSGGLRAQPGGSIAPTFVVRPAVTDGDRISLAADLHAMALKQLGNQQLGQYLEQGRWTTASPELFAIAQEFTPLSLEIGKPEFVGGSTMEHVRMTTDVSRVKARWANTVEIGKQLAAMAPSGVFYLDLWYTKAPAGGFRELKISSSNQRGGEIADLTFP